MEPRFTATTVMDRQCFREFGEIQAGKNIVRNIFLIVFGLLILCLAVLTAQGQMNLIFTLLLFLIFFYLYLFFGRIVGYFARKNLHPALRDIAQTYSFDDEGYHTVSALDASAIRYPAIVKIMETETMFALYINKASAHLIKKSDFTLGTSETFRPYIVERTGKPVLQFRCRRSRMGQWVILAASLLIVIAAILSAFLVQFNTANTPKTFTADEFSITLTEQFQTSDRHQDCVLCVTNHEVFVYTTFESKADVALSMGVEPQPQEYAYYHIDHISSIDRLSFDQVDGGSLFATYVLHAQNGDYYFFDAIRETDNGFWTTRFYCYDHHREKYENAFYQWARTVKISP